MGALIGLFVCGQLFALTHTHEIDLGDEHHHQTVDFGEHLHRDHGHDDHQDRLGFFECQQCHLLDRHDEDLTLPAETAAYLLRPQYEAAALAHQRSVYRGAVFASSARGPPSA